MSDMSDSDESIADLSSVRNNFPRIIAVPSERYPRMASEMDWAVDAYAQADGYFKLISYVDPKTVKLTSDDAKIYQEFRRLFPDLNIDVLNEEDIKNAAYTSKWERLHDIFNNRDDTEFETLIRKDVNGDYSASNSFITMRIHFYAIEVARNKEGLNDTHFINNVYLRNSSES